jgi:hypothetical protein
MNSGGGVIWVFHGANMCYSLAHYVNGWYNMFDTCGFAVAVGVLLVDVFIVVLFCGIEVIK